MNRTKAAQWQRFVQHCREFPTINLTLDISRVSFADDFFAKMEPRMQAAFAEMAALEKGAIANADEQRMVGHYWLRNPALAPTPEIRREIEQNLEEIEKFAGLVHAGKIQGAGGPFKNVLVIGIGGSALGPQFVANALGSPKHDKMRVFFFDNTDPDGMDRVLDQLDGALDKTLAMVISKSGSTKETRNGMVEAELAYKAAGLNFANHAVAITGVGSQLDQYAEKNNWIQRFPMWDWVGGRTSELSGVGLLPAKLQGFDVKGILDGAKSADIVSRGKVIAQNPAALLALAWFHATGGVGSKAMVVLPYKDRLELFSKYLQQLIMESLGKASDRDGKVVNQGIAVYGNKGATDQHSYIQQLRDGLNNYFAVFVEVLRDRNGTSTPVQDAITSGDYLSGFFQGTRQALFENNRESITITIDEVTPQAVGALIALFERAVGFYASLINVNAYHQPGVEAGKKAAETVIQIQQKILAFADKSAQAGNTAEQIARGISQPDEVETVFMVCRHLAANGKLAKDGQGGPSEVKFRKP
ncbi:MAG: hypothetical protein RLZZ350_936 [Verrucomicrobiota bacterium]|jgi:glucose-6-phosphate isomerase